MTNKLTRLNIISKLNFENITTTQNFANIINDNNPYTKLTWNTFSSSATMECIVSDNIKYANLSSNYNRFRTQISYFNDKSFNFIIKFRLTELRSIQNIVTINNGTTHFVCNIKNTFDNGLSLYNSNGDISINCNYKFEADIDYVISISKDEDIYKVIINGTQYLCTENISFKNNLPSSDSSYLILGCVDINPSDNTNSLRGRLYWANLSIGPTMIFNGSYTKYGSSLKSFLYFGNKAINDTATSYYAPLETVEDSIITWNGLETINDENINQDKLICTGTNSFYTNYNINNPFTLSFKCYSNVTLDDVELISYYGYKLLVTNVVNDSGIPDDPEVLVNEYTTSGLDFETGLTDKIPTTVWTKEGTADVTSVNKIFGENSFETKALGDSLYTNSNVITGGSTPFTIEFYALIKDKYGPAGYDAPLISQSKTTSSGEQQLNWGRTIRNVYFYKSDNNTPSLSPVVGKYKFNYNEINKYTLTYDSSALRVFINDKLDSVNGTLYGWNKTDNPIRLLDSLVPTFEFVRHGTKGLIDNINIHDGIATKVRDPDPYEEFLVVDLAFDGENNSTKIVDNGYLKMNWVNNFNLVINNQSSLFGGYSYLKNNNNTKIVSENLNMTLSDNWTIVVDVVKIADDKYSTLYSYNFSYGGVNKVLKLFMHGSQYNWSTYYANKFVVILDVNSYESNQILGSMTNLLISNMSFEINKKYNIRVICDSGIVSLYINDVFDNSIDFNFTGIDYTNSKFHLGGLSADTTASSNWFNGYIKNFKIYKGVAVIPEDPTGKIQLDFDNNLVDKYGNSTWNNNDVTFDQVNSVKGYSAYFNRSSSINLLLPTNQNMNFENKDFRIEMDFKASSVDQSVYVLLGTGHTSIPDSGILNLCFGTSYGLYFSKQNGLIVNTDNVLANQYYKTELKRSNNTVNLYLNNVLVSQATCNDSETFDYSAGGGTRIGSGNWVSSGGHHGYIDNFKSIKDSIETDFAVYPTYTYNLKRFDKRTISLVAYDNNSVVAIFKNMPKVYNFILEFDYVYLSDEQTGITFMGSDITPTIGIDSFGYILYMQSGIVGFGYGGGSYNAIAPTKSHGMAIGSTYKIKIISNNSNFKIYISDNLLFDITDSRDTIPYHIGVRTYGTNIYDINTTNRISNLIVKTLSDDIIYEYLYNDPINTVIDKSVVHLPLETNAINTGFAPLTINSVGNPTYTTIDGKKCIKFEQGKYLTINSNNIFNLGTSSDFYIEMDIYVPSLHTSGYGQSILSNGTSNQNNGGMWFQVNSTIQANTGCISIAYNNSTFATTSNSINLNSWNIFKIYRKDINLYMELNGILTKVNNYYIDFSLAGYTTIGMIYNANNEATLDGYMSNFKMFVGTSEIPETYNDKTVLDLDFKPTGKSYLFKDNNNKCVIHPVNITQRDYQDSQYCCSFNGVDQYIQLGKNELFNFGLDDFIIAIRFKVVSSGNTWNTILSGSSVDSYIDIKSDGQLYIRFNSTDVIRISPVGAISFNVINNLVLVVENNIAKVFLNNVEILMSDSSILSSINFNESSNTYIGAYGSLSTYFSGTIYSIKVFRNTSDLSLLNDPVNTPVITPVETIYTLTDGTNTETISLTPELSDNDITFYNKEFFIDVKVNDDNNVMSLPKNTSITDNTLTINNGFKGYIKDIKFYDTVIPFNDSDSFIDYDPYNTEFNQVQVEIINDDFTELNTMNIGNNNITGFLEGCILPISYDIIHKSTGAILTSGDTPYYSYNNIDIRYIDEYVIIDSNNKEYELINKSLDKEGFLIFVLDAASCQGNFCIRLYKHLTGKLVGEYEIINNQCQIDYLFIDERYDAVLFDRDSNIESKTLSDRIPEIKIV